MKFKPDAPQIKGMLFIGCSFTWGQGLYFYTNLSSLREPPPDSYIESLVTFPHLQYMKANRFARLVATHFNTYELVHRRNSGSNRGNIEYWNKAFKEESLYIGDVSHITFQLTDWARNDFVFEHKGQVHTMPFWQIRMPQYYKIFSEWLTDNGITVDEWIDSYIKTNITEVKEFLQQFENVGIKVALLSWSADYIKFINKDPWLLERLIHVRYKNYRYTSIEDLMKGHKKMMIKYDYENFIVPPQDHHPSRLCHRVLADSIIEYWNIS